jgi:hypothetical protein
VYSRFLLRAPLAAIQYLTQRVPLYRRDRESIDAPIPDLDRSMPGDPDTLQRARAGFGPLFHRRYWILVTDEDLGAEGLIDEILRDPNGTCPSGLAHFETLDGDPARDVQLCDELVVRLPGPWDGPVRVVERSATSFRLATLLGHLEAGEIEFRTGYDERGFLQFTIESWARSGDRRFAALYDRFPIGRELQLQMWAQFCMRAADATGGVRMSNVSCSTQRLDSW